jgi:hypothetical protein
MTTTSTPAATLPPCPKCGRPMRRERIYNESHPGYGQDFHVCDLHGSHDGRWHAPVN